ncbi:MAG: exodeoxyribonuclease V subunit beta [bacterium]|nr:exodeoxyribonuclease V subunit beta [bacterium]
MNRLDPLNIDLRGTSVIEASAGTGKTFTIATLYLRLLLERDLLVSEILVVTYTRAATAELRDRIRRRIAEAIVALENGEVDDDPTLAGLVARVDASEGRPHAAQRLAAALAGFDEAVILTIHGFCQRVLRENAFECRASFDLELLADQNALLEEIVGDYWSRSVTREPEVFIRHLMKEGTSVRSLVDLARRASAADASCLIPDSQVPDDARLAALAVAWSEAMEEVRHSWHASSAQVIRELHDAAVRGDLKKTSYKPAKILDSWEHEMKEALVDPPPATDERTKAIERFATGKLVAGTRVGMTTPEHPLFDACERFCRANDALREVLQERKVEFERELVSTVERESRVRKERRGQHSYDDLLAQVAQALARPGGRTLAGRLRGRHRVALVDEFQDTDRLQYQILRSVWHRDALQAHRDEPPALFLIGDPKQAIYAFRGADVYTYLMAKRDAGEHCFTLGTNWRSDPRMIEAVNTLFGQSDVPFRMHGIPFEPVEPRPGARNQFGRQPSDAPHERGAEVAALDILFMSRPGDKPMNKTDVQAEVSSGVAADIAELVRGDARTAGRRVRPDDVAVLCRTNVQAEAMCRALSEVGVPAALLGSASVFEASEAGELECLLAAVAEPGSAGRVRAALSTRIFGVTGERLDALAHDEVGWDGWLLRMRRWHRDWVERGFIYMFHTLLREERVHVRLLGREGGERRLTNFLHLAEILEQAVVAEHLGPRGLVEWLARMRADRSQRDNAIGDEGELRLESDDDAVKVVTVHQSKGLEYAIAYCPFLWEASKLREAEKKWVRFHDCEREDRVVLDLGSDKKKTHAALAQEEAFAEGVRLLYVALTRAKHRCCIVWGNFRDGDLSPLAALLHPSIAGGAADAATEPIPLKNMDDDQMRAELGELVEASHGSIGLRAFGQQSASHAVAAVEPHTLSRVPVTRRISTTWRHSSFSALSATEARGLHGTPRNRDEGLDYDAVSQPTSLGQFEGEEPDVALNSFPAGAAAGTLLHLILERLDFQESSLERTRDVVADALALHAFDSTWCEVLDAALARVVKTRWSEGGPKLADLARNKRLDELEFLLPVANRAIAGVQQRAMAVADLCEIFERHARSDFHKRYAQRLAELRFEPLAGYLKGFIDLVFEWNGRFYLVDYKSNHLGPTPSSYTETRLEAPMAEHHYVLQYHLYTAALDRYLAHRVEGYDYERHFGGVYYLFLRGMDPDHPVGCGVYHDRPTRECIEALTATLAGRVGVPA